MESQQLKQKVLTFDSAAAGQGGTSVLTSEEESVSVDTPGGHEAEDVIRDILVLCDRLIHLVVLSRRS